jgi:hypothetical protein
MRCAKGQSVLGWCGQAQVSVLSRSYSKFGGEVDGRIEGIVAGLSRLMMGTKKKEGCLSASSEQFWQGDFLFLALNFP